MSSTWIISPNLPAWGLLTLAVVALCAIALRLWLPLRSSQHVPMQYVVAKTPKDIHHHKNEYIIYVWFTIGIVALVFTMFNTNHGCNLFNNNATSDNVLSVLVTFLVAWQIWQTMASRADIKEARDAVNKFDELRDELNKEKEIVEGHLYRMEANLRFSEDNSGYIAFQTYVAALKHYIAGEAEYTAHIHHVLSRISALIRNGYGADQDHWVITHASDVNANIDDIAASIATMDNNLIEARGQLENIRNLINTIRHTNA